MAILTKLYEKLNEAKQFIEHSPKSIRTTGDERTIVNIPPNLVNRIQNTADKTSTSFNNINEEVDIPKYLYHATYKPFLKSIKEKGLGNTRRKMWSDSASGVVYLATDENVAYSYAETAEWLDDVEDYDKYADNIVILKIDTDKLDKTRLSKDSNVIDGDSTFEYHGVISFEFVEDILDKYDIGESLSDYEEDIDNIINEAVKTNSFTPYTAGYILEDGSLLVMDEYHGEEEIREFYPEYSNTHPEEDTCVRIYSRPNEAQYKRLEEIIDYYLNHENYCKVEIWNKPLGKYSFYEVYSLYEGACEDTTWNEKIGNWTGYKLVQIIKNYFNNKVNESRENTNEPTYNAGGIIKSTQRSFSTGKLENINFDYDSRGWITSTGEIISTNNAPHYEKEHKIKNSDNNVKYNFGYERYIGLPKNRMSFAQYETLTKLLDYFFINKSNVGIRSTAIEINYDMNDRGDFKWKLFSPKTHTADDIIKLIKRYYTTGILNEKVAKIKLQSIIHQMEN